MFRSTRVTASVVLAALLLCALAAGGARAQVFSARRMAMGGVVLRGGTGLTSANVAYRAVPAEPPEGRQIPLPLGLVQLAANPPVLSVNDSSFNAFELANYLYELPWNVRLGSSPAPSSDISVSLGRNTLAVNLGDLANAIPGNATNVSMIETSPSFDLGRPFSIGIAPLIHYQAQFEMNDALYRALAHGQAFEPNSDYEGNGHGVSQAALGLDLSYAAPVFSTGDPSHRGGLSLYAGARAKLLRGLLYGGGQGTAGFHTPDTLFGGDSVAVDYDVRYQTADPGGGGMGYGLDLGTACLAGPFEIGLGVNDVRTQIDWRVRESEIYRDSTGNQVNRLIGTNRSLTSTVPTTVTANVLTRIGPLTLAADAVRGPLAWTAHVGAERQFGTLAVRGGLTLDENQLMQYDGGTGVKFGAVGLDLALATNSHNLSRVRVLELGAGLTLH
jgi:hypothetical protein